MPRVVPSQVVETIEKLYYTKEGGDSEWPKDIPMNQAHCATMGAILSLVQQIPNELITLDAEQFFRFEASRQAIQAAIEKSMGQRLDEAGVHPIHLSPIPGLGSENPIRLLHSCLAQCPDEFPSSQTAELLFIERDSAYRESLRQDTSSMNHALANGEWKAATVIAGSLLEALLLWGIEKHGDPAITTAVTTLKAKGELRSNLPGECKEWHLPDYIKVAAFMKLIADESARQAELAKDFRNLIHPGRALRLQQTCNRGTALSAVSAVEHVVNDLSR